MSPGARSRIVDVRREDGFTLAEMMAALLVIAILIGIAIPVYLGQRDRANDAGAGVSVREALPAIAAYFQDHDTYVGMTTDGLRAIYDPALHPSLVLSDLTATSYCAQATFAGRTWSATAGGSIVAGACS
jgi:prepilin-type N-terminal cleavage/methylation domain-containing protein